jgi:hypothetical protein
LPVPLPEDRVLAQTFESQKPNPTHQSLVKTHAKLVERWWQDGIRGTTIHQGLVNRFGFTGAYSSVRRCLRKLHRDHPQATCMLEFEPGEAAQVDFGHGPTITDAWKSRNGSMPFLNRILGSATIDRLRHGAYKILLEGKSYRAPRRQKPQNQRV